MSDEPNPTSPPAAAPSPDEKASEFSQIWVDSLAQVLGQIAGAPLAVTTTAEAPADVPAPDAKDMMIVVTAVGALRGEMSIRVPKAATIGMARLFLGEPQDAAAELQPDHGQALEELLRQVAGYVATAVKPRWGETQFQVQSGSPPSWAAGAAGWWSGADTARCPVWLEWKLSAALHAALNAAPAKTEAAESVSSPSPVSPPGPGNLDLLMDVALEVTLRFGERNLLLREILELGAGSVVELDRKVNEPADLLLDGKLVARGEVVVIDGSYGLKVLDVIQPNPAGARAQK